MLAEIFLLRMEAMYRASEESAPTGKSRFVPITVPPSSPRLLWLTHRAGTSRTLVDRFAQSSTQVDGSARAHSFRNPSGYPTATLAAAGGQILPRWQGKR
jgi:hypothetical protein